MVETYQISRMGYIPEPFSFRDYSSDHNQVKGMLETVGLKTSKSASPTSASVDLRSQCTPVFDQGALGSCTSNAGCGMVEYFEKRSFGSYTNASRRFLYKVTRDLLQWTGDTGAFLRTTMGALTLFGVCEEVYWPYNPSPPDNNPDYDVEPPAFCYAFSENYKSIQYIRLDQPSISTVELLNSIKDYLSKGFPSIFGFPVYKQVYALMNGDEKSTGIIPYPCPTDTVYGGHAMMVVGFDDNKQIRNRACDVTTTGALIIRNSWGTGWGENGYGYLAYDYVLKGLAQDWWTIVKQEWVDSKQFGESP